VWRDRVDTVAVAHIEYLGSSHIAVNGKADLRKEPPGDLREADSTTPGMGQAGLSVDVHKQVRAARRGGRGVTQKSRNSDESQPS
jgi:hypothetical protein